MRLRALLAARPGHGVLAGTGVAYRGSAGWVTAVIVTESVVTTEA